jgi:hypothetical protein
VCKGVPGIRPRFVARVRSGASRALWLVPAPSGPAALQALGPRLGLGLHPLERPAVLGGALGGGDALRRGGVDFPRGQGRELTLAGVNERASMRSRSRR